MDGLHIPTAETWKSCMGMCVVCGTPLGLESGRRVKKDNADDDEGLTEALSRDDVGDLLQESDVRVAMFRYNLLGQMEHCHVIDRYTTVKPRSAGEGGDFFQQLKKNPHIVKLFGGRLQQDLLSTSAAHPVCVYDQAVEVCGRLVERVTVPGCRECNSAMNRASVHADIVYRCFEPTALAVLPELESRSKKDQTISKGIKVKKWIQQVAFYFERPTDETWRVKSDHAIILDAAIYRCVANLCMWAQSGYPRFRAIAVFYGAWYIFHARGLRDTSTTFVMWHLHVFRDFYMQQYRGPCTWFGMTQLEASRRFDTTRKEGLQWMQTARERLDTCAVALEASTITRPAERIDAFHKTMLANVNNEVTLLGFVSRKRGVDLGLQTLFRFLLYNVRDAKFGMLERRVHAFMADVTRLLVSGHQTTAKPDTGRRAASPRRRRRERDDDADLADSVWRLEL